jgi:hypothetical protein
MQLFKNNLGTAVTGSVACTAVPGAWQSLSLSTTSLALNDSFDLSITAVTTSKRMTVCVASSIN